MEKTIRSKTSFCVFLLSASYLQLVTESLNQIAITSLLFYTVILGTVLFWLVYEVRKENIYNTMLYITLATAVGCLMIDAVLQGGFRITYYKKLVFFACFLMINRVVMEDIDTDRLRSWLFGLNTICSLVYIALYYIDQSAMFHRSTEIYSEYYLTLNLENPNKAALFITFFFTVNVLAFMERKGLFNKLVSAVCVFYFGEFLILTGSRNGQIVSLAFLVMLVLFRKKRGVKKKFWNNFIAIAPLTLAIVYLLTIDFIAQSGKLDFLIYEGKGLTSRQEIWKASFDKLGGDFLWGSFLSYINPTTGTFQLHNTHIDVLCSYGLIVLLLYVRFLTKILADLAARVEHDRRNVRYYLGFVVMILMGFAEAAAVNGTNGFPILGAAFIALGMNGEAKAAEPQKLLAYKYRIRY